MTGWLEGKVALVTGGASGIGRAIADRFVREGARVVVMDVTPERFEHADRERRVVHVVSGDVTLLADNVAAVAEATRRFGRLDVFVGNSGISDGFTALRDLGGDVIEAAFDELFAVNVKGYLLGAKAALPALLETSGCMIFTLSNSSFYPDGGGPLYVASKHACLGVVRQLAFELAPRIRVNGVAPGGTVTDIRLPASFGLDERGERRRAQDAPDLDEMIESVTPLRISARPEDHAAAYVLLASAENARTITGTVVSTDAGLGIRGIRRVRGGDER